MKVKMLRTEKGAEDGIKVRSYEKGQTYNIAEKLAKIFITIKAAEPVAEEIALVAPDVEKKDAKQAPENKAAKEEENKKDKKEEDSKK